MSKRWSSGLLQHAAEGVAVAAFYVYFHREQPWPLNACMAVGIVAITVAVTGFYAGLRGPAAATPPSSAPAVAGPERPSPGAP